jgi:hypothetical protein
MKDSMCQCSYRAVEFLSIGFLVHTDSFPPVLLVIKF